MEFNQYTVAGYWRIDSDLEMSGGNARVEMCVRMKLEARSQIIGLILYLRKNLCEKDRCRLNAKLNDVTPSSGGSFPNSSHSK